MFGLGAGEILLIAVFALIFIGPKKLPELAKNLGRSLREFQKAKDELLHQVHTNDTNDNNDNKVESEKAQPIVTDAADKTKSEKESENITSEENQS